MAVFTLVGLWGIGFGLWRGSLDPGSMNNFMIVVLGVVNLFLGAFMTYLYLTQVKNCLLYTSPSPRDVEESRMPSSA